VPMRLTALQKREHVLERLVNATAKQDDSLLLGVDDIFEDPFIKRFLF